ncbi:MAG: hypothetical protein DRO93_05990 [Candidatus Thorarchaeota archaeon]|nr:MAG: hypothetical protein DRO93_05990 [Candidatus Thorarchaeota archaeon]
MDSQFLFYLVGLTGFILISYAVMFVGETSDYYDREKNASDGSSAGENSFGEWSYTLYLARRRVWYLLWGVPHLLGCILLEVVALSIFELVETASDLFDYILFVVAPLGPLVLFLAVPWKSRCLD